MFVQHTYIDEIHKPTLETIIRQHQGVTEPFLAALYRACLDAQTNQTNPRPSAFILARFVSENNTVLASATDEKTGIYLQLAGDLKSSNQLTVGQKWAMQGKDPKMSTMATKMWQG